ARGPRPAETSSRTSRRRAASITWPPPSRTARAEASPIPVAPPVTKATLPAKFAIRSGRRRFLRALGVELCVPAAIAHVWTVVFRDHWDWPVKLRVPDRNVELVVAHIVRKERFDDGRIGLAMTVVAMLDQQLL